MMNLFSQLHTLRPIHQNAWTPETVPWEKTMRLFLAELIIVNLTIMQMNLIQLFVGHSLLFLADISETEVMYKLMERNSAWKQTY